MITIQNKTFKLDTHATTYLFRVLPGGQLEQLYYGRYITGDGDNSALWESYGGGYGNTVAYSQQDTAFSLDLPCLELSGVGKGDFREPSIELSRPDGCFVTDYRYRTHCVSSGRTPIAGLPSAYGDCDTLEIVMDDPISDSSITLFYHVFARCNVITRHMTVTAGKVPLLLRRAMSMQLDLPECGYSLVSFHGAWVREMQPQETKLTCGSYRNDSKTGVSSNQHNPFIMIKSPNCNETGGGCYGFNLIYSGNHCEIAEVGAFGRTRILSGLSPFSFARKLECGESFCTPESVMTYSHHGMDGVSTNMHRFVRGHIVRGWWKERRRPVPVNGWEANYFDFDEEKLVAQAQSAKALGAELYVVDDGWFGKRNGDDSSLGDWFENPKKLPCGLSGLAERFAKIPIALGLWIEPEMISTDSELYRSHPDWALAVPGNHHSMGRNQLVLDLTRDEICDHIVRTVSDLLASADIAYVKWDMNRNLSDLYSAAENHNSDLYHRYVLGFYRIAEEITAKFPKILFEGCAGGGNRFDLGVLCYMPQIWLSDNTDAHCRMAIQTGAGYGYPQSVFSAHLSGCPNHQTGRAVPLESRFNIASFALLGYELDVTKLSDRESAEINKQIEWYKEHGHLLQFGSLHRLEFNMAEGFAGWIIVSEDAREAFVLVYQHQFIPNSPSPLLRFPGLAPALRYSVREITGSSRDYTANGDMLCYAGVRPDRISPVAGQGKALLVLPDFGTVIYHVRAV